MVVMGNQSLPRVGDFVVLSGLSRAELNGQNAQALPAISALLSGRLPVKLTVSDQCLS